MPHTRSRPIALPLSSHRTCTSCARYLAPLQRPRPRPCHRSVNGLEPPILRSLVAACEKTPSLWPTRLTYEQGHIRPELRQPLIDMFTRKGGYERSLKPASMRKAGHDIRYSRLTWDMVLNRAPSPAANGSVSSEANAQAASAISSATLSTSDDSSAPGGAASGGTWPWGRRSDGDAMADTQRQSLLRLRGVEKQT